MTIRGVTKAGADAAYGLIRTAVKTAAYTAAPGDLVPVDTTSGNVTITLPNAPVDGAQVGVKHIVQGGTNTVTIARSGADVINKAGGSTSLTLTLLNQASRLKYDAATKVWTVVGDDLPLSGLDGRFLKQTNAQSQITLKFRDGNDVAAITGLVWDIPVGLHLSAAMTWKTAGVESWAMGNDISHDTLREHVPAYDYRAGGTGGDVLRLAPNGRMTYGVRVGSPAQYQSTMNILSDWQYGVQVLTWRGNGGVPPTINTTLTNATNVGDTTIVVPAWMQVGQTLTIGTGGTVETVVVADGITGTGPYHGTPYTVTVTTALTFAHSAGEAVVGTPKNQGGFYADVYGEESLIAGTQRKPGTRRLRIDLGGGALGAKGFVLATDWSNNDTQTFFIQDKAAGALALIIQPNQLVGVKFLGDTSNTGPYFTFDTASIVMSSRGVTGPNFGLFSASYANGAKVVALGNCGTVPSGLVSGGIVLYSDSGTFAVRQSNGDVFKPAKQASTPAAATDLASAIALVNFLRTAAQTQGLVA